MDIWRRPYGSDPTDDASAGSRAEERFSVGLVLGGGAARGFAHIGVLRTLSAYGIRPDVIAGTSIGAVVGGFVALVAVIPLVGWADQHEPDGSAAQVAVILAGYAVGALIAALSGGLAASASVRGPTSGRVGRRATEGLVVSGVIATVVTVSFARATDYSTRSSVILSEFGLVICICSIGLAWAAMSMRPRSKAASPTA